MTTAKPLAAAPPPRPARLYPGWVGRITIALCLLLTAIVRTLPQIEGMPFPWNEMALPNILTYVFTFIAALTLLVWFCLLSSYAALVRWLVLAGVLALVGMFFAAFRYEGVDGSMVFRFRPRWRPVVESTVGKIEKSAQATGADLLHTTDDDFPQFLGPDRSGYLSRPDLAADWTAQPPKLLWRRPIGAGWSGFVAVNGFAVTLEQRGDDEWVACYEIATGNPVWGQAIAARHFNPLGGLGPRSTPTIHAGRVYALGATGVLRCLDGKDGTPLWQVDLRARAGLDAAQDEALIQWGRAGSPLIVDDLVVVPAGGPTGQAKSLVAFKAETGDVAWEGGTDQISYASPALATLAGSRQILIVNEATVSGHNPQTGAVLWSYPWPGHSNQDASASQAVPVPGDRVLLTKGYSGGAELLQLTAAADGTLQATSLWANPQVMGTKLNNVSVIGGHIYGLDNGILECVDLESGRRVWKQGRYGFGQILCAGPLTLVQAEDGRVALVEANPERFVERGSIDAFSEKTWNNLCLYGHKLLVRNDREAACYELP